MTLSGVIYTFAVTSLAVTLVMETAEGCEGAVDRALDRVIVKTQDAVQTVKDAAKTNPWLASVESAVTNQSSR